MDPLTLAIPTGRLFADTCALLQRVGWLAAVPTERTLVLPASDGRRVLIAKPADILTYVEQGAADAGIVGKDMLLEQERDVYELVDLGFGSCRGVVALPEAQQERWRQPGTLLRIATKYPRLTTRFFERERRPVEIVPLHGSVELAPRVGLADGIVDLVMTGQTLRDNLLAEVAEVFQSSARLVVNRVSLRTKAAVVQPLVEQTKRTTTIRAPVTAAPTTRPTAEGDR
jgi:ATP phosphoribosyltransferase